jgi:hypothetical protein
MSNQVATSQPQSIALAAVEPIGFKRWVVGIPELAEYFVPQPS